MSRAAILIVLVAAACAGTALSNAAAQTSPPADPPIPAAPATPQAPAAKRPPMQFDWVREGPADQCRDRCREWISASGDIVAETPRLFVAFAQTRDVRRATIVLDSAGGAVGPAIALGRLLRRFEVATSVGKTIKLAGADAERASLSPKGFCASACTFVLMGGARRTVPAGARVLVHQIWPGTKREDALAANYTAGDLLRLQRDLGRVARYLTDMGADILLFETTMRVPPWETLRPLTQDEVRLMRLHVTDDPFAPVATPLEARPAALPLQALAGSVRGWTVTDASGARGLVRKHPITIEGEEIGSFELSLTCGATAGGYAAAYVETRRLADAMDDRLNAVLIAIGKERAQLKIESSAAEAGSGELRSQARGTLPAVLVEALATAEGRGLIVATRSIANVRTAIRIGNNGFAPGYAQTIATCAR
ncbi:MAG: hypothetical protein HY056_18360 [Proteobacteria bacterium]|nr:hypothetical protein [Pseudomonadota bacterium]